MYVYVICINIYIYIHTPFVRLYIILERYESYDMLFAWPITGTAIFQAMNHRGNNREIPG